MRLSFQACFIAISIVLGMNANKSPPSCAKPFDKMTACNLICNMIHDSDANSAMKMLQTKLESLTSMIKKPPQQGGKTGFDTQEAKLPSYWNTPFSNICLGMKIGKQIKFMVIKKQASSLYSLIGDGKYHATSMGCKTWKMLIGLQASLQCNCNKEGFNAIGSNNRVAKARIGIVSNQENDCASCDSTIGFGTGVLPVNSNTCGDNGDKDIKAMGYILVQ